MKQFALLLASVSLVVLPALPAHASLVAATPPAVDNLKCLTLLLTNPEEHAAKCGGPFTMDEGKEPLVKGTFTKGCPLIAMTPLSLFGEEWRVDVAVTDCCDLSYVAPGEMDLTFGEVFRFRVAC